MAGLKPSVIVASMLRATAGITAIASTRVWADVQLPPAYSPATGPAMLIWQDDVQQLYPTIRPLQGAYLNFESYAEDFATARNLDNALHAWVDEFPYGLLVDAEQGMRAKEMRTQDKAWPVVWSKYRITFRGIPVIQ